jgi:hypothetical protein
MNVKLFLWLSCLLFFSSDFTAFFPAPDGGLEARRGEHLCLETRGIGPASPSIHRIMARSAKSAATPVAQRRVDGNSISARPAVAPCQTSLQRRTAEHHWSSSGSHVDRSGRLPRDHF